MPVQEVDTQDLVRGLQAQRWELPRGSNTGQSLGPTPSCLRDGRVMLSKNEGNKSRDEQK